MYKYYVTLLASKKNERLYTLLHFIFFFSCQINLLINFLVIPIKDFFFRSIQHPQVFFFFFIIRKVRVRQKVKVRKEKQNFINEKWLRYFLLISNIKSYKKLEYESCIYVHDRNSIIRCEEQIIKIRGIVAYSNKHRNRYKIDEGRERKLIDRYRGHERKLSE